MTRAPHDAAVAEVHSALQRLFRLGGSRRIFAQQAAAAQAPVSRQGMTVLAALAADGPLALGSLARASGLEPAAVTRTVRVLVADGLVVTAPDPRDKRSSIARPTRKGLCAHERYTTVGAGHIEHALNGWTAGDRRRFGELLGRFVADVQARPFAREDAS